MRPVGWMPEKIRTLAAYKPEPAHAPGLAPAPRATISPMAPEPKVKSDTKVRPSGPWTPEEIARNERANRAQVERDRKRGASVNLEETVALTRFANRFAEAFRHARGA